MDGDQRTRSMRYPALDVLRAFALVSMVSYHVTDEDIRTGIARILHSAVWIDGAFFFVALSGVVTGLVHRRLVDRGGVRQSSIKLARRAGFLYAVHITLVVTIISLHSADRADPMPFTPTWGQGHGLVHLVAQVLTLRTEPDFTDVLPMYVFFLLGAILAVRLLAKGRYRDVIAISGAIYVGGRIFGGAALAAGSFEMAGWQLLFVGGLLVGWTWEHERLALAASVRRDVVRLATAVAVALFVLARVARGAVAGLPGAPVDKMSGGLVAFAFAGAVLVVGYALIERLGQQRWARPTLSAVAIAGSKGLPGYVAMVLCVLVLQLVPSIPRNDAVVVLVAVICGLTELTALKVDAWRRARDSADRRTGRARPATGQQQLEPS